MCAEPRLQGHKITSVASFDGDVRCLTSVSMGQTLSVWCGERNGTVTVRDPETAAIRRRLAREESPFATEHVVCCLIQVGAEVWMGTSSGRMRIYCALSQQLLVERIRHAGGICAMTSLSRYVYSAATDFIILEWDQQARDTTTKIFGQHKSPVRSLCVCGGHLVSGSDDRDIRVWDTSTAETTFVFHCTDCVLALCHVPVRRAARGQPGGEDSLWAGDNEGKLLIYEWAEMRCTKEQQAHGAAVCNLLCKQDLVFSSSMDRTVKVWERSSCMCVKVLNDSASHVTSLVVVGCNVQTRLWSVSSGRKIQAWSLEQRGVANEDSSRLQDEADHLSLHVQRLQQQLVAAQASERDARAEADHARTEADANSRTWQVAEHGLLEQLAQLRTTLRQRDSELASLKSELDQARQRADQLESSEKERLQSSKAGSTTLDELSELLTSTVDLEQTKSELISQQDMPSSPEGDLSVSEDQPSVPAEPLQERQEPQEEPDRELQAAEGDKAAIIQNKLLEKQIDDDIGLKISRLAFISEVWSVYRQVFDSHRCVETAIHSKPPISGGALKAGQRQDLRMALEAISRAREQCAAVIRKYLTDHEKLHLGIPLAPEQFQDGMDAEKLLDENKKFEPNSLACDEADPLCWSKPNKSGEARKAAAEGQAEPAAPMGTGARMPWSPRARSPQQPGQRQQRQLRSSNQQPPTPRSSTSNKMKGSGS